MSDPFSELAEKMASAGANPASIRTFQHSYSKLLEGDSGMLPESQIQPVQELPRLEDLRLDENSGWDLLSKCIMIKLNGGLGTSMGLERAKSLLEVKEGLTFLDLIARQILRGRDEHGEGLRFMLMNSISTSEDTRAYLAKYPQLGAPREWELIQSMAPKIDASTLRAVGWPANRQLEWCPPGHGDIYPSLLGSGWLDRLIEKGVAFAFVSNSDNLGANLDPALLAYFAKSDLSFMMEVAERTASDKKGGHLARRGGTYLLRESAQCPDGDLEQFQDIEKHRFFNTNNLWIRLDRLQELLQKSGGVVPLPIIKNLKTVDPRDKTSKPVIQLETAMGAAIELFDKSGAVVVPRSRFAPVKTTSDLLALRSDAYDVTDDWRVTLAIRGVDSGRPPSIDLDSDHYKLIDQLDAALARGVPSLRKCQELIVRGPVLFNSRNEFRGRVAIENSGEHRAEVPPGAHEDTILRLDQLGTRP